MNDQLWSKFPLLRDNGVVTIGSYISVMNPNPITTMFCNEIPLIESRWGCIVMKDPAVMVEVPVDTSIEQNCTRCFLRNKVQIDVVATTIHTTQCSGLFCDKQRSVEILRGQRACGCYHMNNRVGSLALAHEIDVSLGDNQLMSMVDFSSTKFSNLYLKSPFLPWISSPSLT